MWVPHPRHVFVFVARVGEHNTTADVEILVPEPALSQSKDLASETRDFSQ
jgi:hypothetical protein